MISVSFLYVICIIFTKFIYSVFFSKRGERHTEIWSVFFFFFWSGCFLTDHTETFINSNFSFHDHTAYVYLSKQGVPIGADLQSETRSPEALPSTPCVFRGVWCPKRSSLVLWNENTLVVGVCSSASSILLSSERTVACVLWDWWLCKVSQGGE